MKILSLVRLPIVEMLSCNESFLGRVVNNNNHTNNSNNTNTYNSNNSNLVMIDNNNLN